MFKVFENQRNRSQQFTKRYKSSTLKEKLHAPTLRI